MNQTSDMYTTALRSVHSTASIYMLAVVNGGTMMMHS